MWEWFIQLLTIILEFIKDFCGDWGLAIILLTFAVRGALTPLTIRSTRSTAQMQIIQPRIQEIREKYADDPQRQNEEISKLYTQFKFNPLGGCLPVLLQMPIFFALFTVLRNLPGEAHFYDIFPSLAESFQNSVATVGWLDSWLFLVFDVAFGVLTLVPMLLNSRNSDGAQRSQSLIMGVIMAVMMVWFGWGVPVGVLLYYNTSAVWGIIQQVVITNHMMEKYKKEEEERMLNAPIQVNVVRRERTKRQRKKS